MIGRKNKYVIKVDYHEVNEILPKYIVHHVLEDCRVLEMSIVCSESRFPLVSRLDMYQI